MQQDHEDQYNTSLFLSHGCFSLLEVHQARNIATKMSKNVKDINLGNMESIPYTEMVFSKPIDSTRKGKFMST